MGQQDSVVHGFLLTSWGLSPSLLHLDHEAKAAAGAVWGLLVHTQAGVPLAN